MGSTRGVPRSGSGCGDHQHRVAQRTPILGRIVVRAQFRRVTTPIILATIPGSGPNRIVVESKTDGTNVTEDNAPLAMVAMARYFAALPAGCRPRTLEFAFSTEHFYQRLLGRDTRDGGAEALARRLDADYARGQGSVVITLEHLGARDYRRAPRGHGRTGYILRPTGRRAIPSCRPSPSTRRPRISTSRHSGLTASTSPSCTQSSWLTPRSSSGSARSASGNSPARSPPSAGPEPLAPGRALRHERLTTAQ